MMPCAVKWLAVTLQCQRQAVGAHVLAMPAAWLCVTPEYAQILELYLSQWLLITLSWQVPAGWAMQVSWACDGTCASISTVTVGPGACLCCFGMAAVLAYPMVGACLAC